MERMGVVEFSRAFQNGQRDFSGVRIDGSEGPHLGKVEISDLVIAGGSFDVDAIGTRFVRCKFIDGIVVGRMFSYVELEGCDFSKALVTGEFSHTRFVDCSFSEAHVFFKAEHTRFEGTTEFRKAELPKATFTACTFAIDSNHPFRDTKFGTDVTMDLESFASLPVGALTSWQESAIVIADDAVRLRQSFSGLKRSLYLLLLLLFLAPHLLFIISEWVAGMGACAIKPCKPLYSAFVDHVMSGGPMTLITFLVLLAYHVVRTILVAKANSLEVESAARHTRVRFDLDSPVMLWLARRQQASAAKRYIAQHRTQSAPSKPAWIERIPNLRWRHLVWYLRYGLWVNLVLLLIHAQHFLTTPVP